MPMDDSTGTTSSNKTAQKPGIAPPGKPVKTDGWRKPVGLIISIAAIPGVVVLTLWVWRIIEHHPRTDDAIVQANVIGVAPRVRGQIIKLNVQDNQQVQEGDVLFEIDPADYKLDLENAKSALAALEQEIEVGRAHD